ncbi:MAG: PAS domain-containing protein [Pseudomonadota bacterium]
MDGDDWVNEDCIQFNEMRLEKTGTMIHSELRGLHSYWERVRRGRLTPMRSDIDPRQMECDARNLFILENLGRGNIRFRLAGTAIVDSLGMELRGMNARAIMASSSRESFTALISEVLEDPGTGYARLRSSTDNDVIWEVSLLPLRSDFGAIDRVIGCLHPLTNGLHHLHSPLRFRIEHMSVEPVGSAIEERREVFQAFEFPDPMDDMRRGIPPVDLSNGRGFRAIEGGLSDRNQELVAAQRNTSHLRLVKSETDVPY